MISADRVHRPTQRVYTIRGITSQAAADLKFLLSGRDGGVDRMVSVVDYFQRELSRFSIQLTSVKNNIT